MYLPKILNRKVDDIKNRDKCQRSNQNEKTISSKVGLKISYTRDHILIHIHDFFVFEYFVIFLNLSYALSPLTK